MHSTSCLKDGVSLALFLYAENLPKKSTSEEFISIKNIYFFNPLSYFFNSVVCSVTSFSPTLMWTNPHHVTRALDCCNALCLILHAKSPQKVVLSANTAITVVAGSPCKASLMPVLHRLLSNCFFGTTKCWGFT